MHVSQATPYHWCLLLVRERLASKTSLRLAVYHVLYFRDAPVTSVTVISQFAYQIEVMSTFGDNRDVLCMCIFIITMWRPSDFEGGCRERVSTQQWRSSTL